LAAEDIPLPGLDSSGRELPVSFSTFVVSLASSAMVHLGEAPDPGSGGKSLDLPLARNTIDLLGLLREKTKGNLDDEEKQLLDALLYELRTKFMTPVKGA
jgi:hypothetical protein